MGPGEEKFRLADFDPIWRSSEDLFLFCWLVMSCCRNGFFVGKFAGRRNMTVILTFDPQFTESTVQITPIVFPRRSHYGCSTLQANKKDITHRANAVAH